MKAVVLPVAGFGLQRNFLSVLFPAATETYFFHAQQMVFADNGFAKFSDPGHFAAG